MQFAATCLNELHALTAHSFCLLIAEWLLCIILCSEFNSILSSVFICCYLFVHCSLCVRMLSNYNKLLKLLRFVSPLQRSRPCHLRGHYLYGIRLLPKTLSAVLSGAHYLQNLLVSMPVGLLLTNRINFLVECLTVKKPSTVQLKEIPQMFFTPSTSLCGIHRLTVVLLNM